MQVNILKLPSLNVLDCKETDTAHHVQAEPTVISRLCPHCGRSDKTVKPGQKSLFIRDMPSHGKSVAIHLNVPRLRCKPCDQTFTAKVPGKGSRLPGWQVFGRCRRAGDSGSEVQPRLARPTLGRRLRIQRQVSNDLHSSPGAWCHLARGP